MVVAELLIAMMKTAAKSYLHEDEEYSSTCCEVMLCAGVFLGQCEGRLVTSAKIAAYLGIPRTTATRKLQALAKRGVIERVKPNKWRIPEQRVAAAEAHIVANTQHIHRAEKKLSKLDSSPIAAESARPVRTKNSR